MSADDDRLDERLRDALVPPPREPPADRLAALRAEADRRRLAGPAPARDGATSGRRGFLGLGAAAAAGAALGVAGFAVADSGDEAKPGPPTEAIALTGLPAGVAADAKLINHTWGVELLLDVDGLRAGDAYDVVYTTTDGDDLRAGSFLGVDGPMACRMTGALLRDRTAAIEVRGPGGAVVMRSRLA